MNCSRSSFLRKKVWKTWFCQIVLKTYSSFPKISTQDCVFNPWQTCQKFGGRPNFIVNSENGYPINPLLHFWKRLCENNNSSKITFKKLFTLFSSRSVVSKQSLSAFKLENWEFEKLTGHAKNKFSQLVTWNNDVLITKVIRWKKKPVGMTIYQKVSQFGCKILWGG